MFNIPPTRKRSEPSKNATEVEGKNIKIVVGLGNPGGKYGGTYHNAGYLFLDHILQGFSGNESGKPKKWKNKKSFAYVKLGDLIIAKPNTFMNASGPAIGELIRYFKVKPDELLVAHDDSDISFGEYKISFGRGSAGHKGIEAIIKSIGTDEFLRLRIGVRHSDKKAGEFVLGRIPQHKLKDLNNLFSEIKTSYFET